MTMRHTGRMAAVEAARLLHVLPLAGLLCVAGCTTSSTSSSPSSPSDASVVDAGCGSWTTLDPLAKPKPLLDESGAWYRYAPAIIREDGLTRIWACGNVDAFEVRDNIVYSEVREGAAPSPWKSVFAATDGAWDSVHTCDPTIVAGQFRYKGETYDHALFYSGNDVDAIHHVQLGLALSKGLAGGGRWQRVSGPLIGYPNDGNWGLGQPSALALGGGRVVLFYTRADPVPHVYVRQVDLSDAEHPKLGTEVRLSEQGLIGFDDAPDVLTNVDVVINERTDQLLLLSERHPLPTDNPPGLARGLVVLGMDRETALAGGGRWTSLAAVERATSGSTRNHNGGFVRRASGELPADQHVELFYANSCEACTFPGALFAVRLQRLRFAGRCSARPGG